MDKIRARVLMLLSWSVRTLSVFGGTCRALTMIRQMRFGSNSAKRWIIHRSFRYRFRHLDSLVSFR